MEEVSIGIDLAKLSSWVHGATKTVPCLPQDRHEAKNAALSGAHSRPVARQGTLRPL